MVFDMVFRTFCFNQPAPEEQKEELEIKKESEVEEVKKEGREKKEEPTEQQGVTKGEEKTTEQAKKKKPSKQKKTEKKPEEAKGPKRPKTMQCKVTLLDDTLFECEFDVRETQNYTFSTNVDMILYPLIFLSTVIQTEESLLCPHQ